MNKLHHKGKKNMKTVSEKIFALEIVNIVLLTKRTVSSMVVWK